MKLSHRELEDCSSNPTKWLQKKKNAANGSFARMGYDGYTKLAILAFHNSNSEKFAREKLFAYLSRFKDISRINECEDTLDSYIKWFYNNNPIIIKTRIRINIDIDYGNSIVGEITRVDLHTDGYVGVLLGHKSENWHAELRMPLIQYGLAMCFDRNFKDFHVGSQNLDGSGFEYITYKELDIKKALRKAEKISMELSELSD